MGANSAKMMRKDNYGNWFLDFSYDVLFGEDNHQNENDEPEYEKLKFKPYSFIGDQNGDDSEDDGFAEMINEICDDEKNISFSSTDKDDLISYPEISRNIMDQAIIIINIAPKDIEQYNKTVPYEKKAILMGYFNEPKVPYYMIRRKSNCPDIYDQPIPGQVKRSDLTNGYCYAAGCSIVVKRGGKTYGIFHKDYTKSFETCLGGCASRDDWLKCVEGKITPGQFYLGTALREVEEETTGIVKGRKIKGIDFEKYTTPLSNICEIGYNQKYFEVDNLDDTYRMYGAVIDLDIDSNNINDPYFTQLFDDQSNYCPVSRTYKLSYDKSDLNPETEYVCARELITEDLKNETGETKVIHLKSFLQQIKEHRSLLETDKINRSIFALLGTHLNLEKRKCLEFDQAIYSSTDLKNFGFPPRMVYIKPLSE